MARYLYLSWLPLKFGPAEVIVISPHHRTVKSSCTVARSAALAIFLPAIVEAMRTPADVLMLRLHSRRLPEQLDHARSNELGTEASRSLFQENLMTCVMERVIRNISYLGTRLITTTGPFPSTHAIWIRVITKGSARKSVDPAAGFMSK